MRPGRILVTGSTGFIGSHLVPWLTGQGRKVRVALRNPAELPPCIESAVIGDIADPRNLSRALEDVDTVVHCAGVAHASPTLASTTIADEVYTRVNRDATLDLARAAVRAGVRRFVFLSSIRAQTGPVANGVLTEDSEPMPTDAYGRSKLEAEVGLAGMAIDWVALRPVLVYGPGVKGNMQALLKLAHSPWPVPLGMVDARRSILAIENLCSAVLTLIDVEGPLRKPVIAADITAPSVGAMVAAMREGLGRKPGLLPVPEAILGMAARLAGQSATLERLTGSLQASPAALMRLGWVPAVEAEEALARLAQGWRPPVSGRDA